MSLMDLFRSKGSASPSSGSQRGDWKDWFLNREGMAGKFNRRKDEDDWIDYNPYMLFNGGGSVGRDRMGGSYNPRRDPTPNTMGLMQGDLRDTHHYPSSMRPHELQHKNTPSIPRHWRSNDPVDRNVGIMQMAYRPGAYGTDYDYDDYGPFVPQSVFEMDEFGGEYDPVDDEYLFDLLRGNLTSIGQGIG